MPDLWTRRLLRRFAEPARHRPLRADGASGLPVVRAGRSGGAGASSTASTCRKGT